MRRYHFLPIHDVNLQFHLWKYVLLVFLKTISSLVSYNPICMILQILNPCLVRHVRNICTILACSPRKSSGRRLDNG